mmetsp:Transcript_23057/g.50252  ORF Transcript_23057/g.50252 Transcript_23057/m.50252 type:complete len:227 (-) Transcript_23057:846-1526(-)
MWKHFIAHVEGPILKTTMQAFAQQHRTQGLRLVLLPSTENAGACCSRCSRNATVVCRPPAHHCLHRFGVITVKSLSHPLHFHLQRSLHCPVNLQPQLQRHGGMTCQRGRIGTTQASLLHSHVHAHGLGPFHSHVRRVDAQRGVPDVLPDVRELAGHLMKARPPASTKLLVQGRMRTSSHFGPIPGEVRDPSCNICLVCELTGESGTQLSPAPGTTQEMVPPHEPSA